VDIITEQNDSNLEEITCGQIPESDVLTRSRRRTLAVKRLTFC